MAAGWVVAGWVAASWVVAGWLGVVCEVVSVEMDWKLSADDGSGVTLEAAGAVEASLLQSVDNQVEALVVVAWCRALPAAAGEGSGLAH